ATSCITLLSKLIEEENGQLQYKIVAVLGKWNVPETLPLLEKAMKSSETYVRLAAEKFLQKRGIVSQKPQKRFSTILEMKDWHARAEAVLILAESSEILMERENFLLQILSQDENLYVRVSAITALAKFPKSEPILSSLKIALSDSSDLVRSAVIQTWGKMPISSEDVLSLFPSLLKDVSASVRFSAVKLIGFLGVDTPEIRAILTQHILSDPECNVRQMAIKVLSCFLPPQEQIQQTLQKAFQDPRAEVRAIAILGFHKQWTPEVDFLCILKPFLEDENEQVRKATLLSLNEFKLSSKKMLEILDSFLEEESDWNVQITAIEILASFSEPQEKIIERLYKTLMKDPEEEVKLEAIVALKKMGENFRIKPILQKLVKSGNPVLRASAKKLLEDLS
ncbi:MAG: HEAT repeat domain-containing protein, partial [Planctomycetota bacterium]